MRALKAADIKALLAFAMGVLVALLRPTAFGEVYSLQIAVLLSGFLLLIIFMGFSFRDRFDKYFYLQLLIAFLTALYVLVRSGAELYSETGDLIKGFLLTSIVIGAILAVTQRREFVLKFYDGIACVVIFCCFSITISALLYFAGMRTDSILVATMKYTYEGRGDIVFPFTFIYNPVDTWFGIIPRLSGIYREPGIVPAFASWAIAYVYWRRWNFVFLGFLVSGSILSFSSIGFLALYPVAIILLGRWRIPPIAAFGMITTALLLAWPTLYLMDIGGIQTKALNGSGSFDERYDQFMAFFDTKNFVFGDGPHWSVYATAGINVLSASRGLGLVYLTLILALVLIPLRNSYMFFTGIVPCIFTVFTSQPIVFSDSMLAVWLSWVVIASRSQESGRKLRQPGTRVPISGRPATQSAPAWRSGT
jgi:hypothetical protein